MERLSKIMAARGICSRREADLYISRGLVEVDGQIISELGTRVSADAKISLLPEARKQQDERVTILLNKPLGYVSTQPEMGYPDALELLTAENCEGPYKFFFRKGLGAVGRLDINSKGLLLFTQDGVLARHVIGPNSCVEKEYLVTIEGEVSEQVLNKLRYGLELDGKALKRAVVERMEPGLFRFVLTEGKKRQIRRMCDLVGLKVIKLKRVRIGRLRLGDLPEGKWRFLLPHEKI